MNVVPLKQYHYSEWCTIAHENNVLRTNRKLPPWSATDIWLLWQAFFDKAVA